MTESSVCARKSIHDRSLRRAQSYEEDESIRNDSVESSKNHMSDPGSDTEENEDMVHISRSCNNELKTRRSVPVAPQRLQRESSLLRTPDRKAFKSNRHSSNNSTIIVTISAILFGLVIYILLAPSQPRVCSFENLKEQYPKENSELWHQLKVGVESILNRRTEMPAVYLFTHHSGKQPHRLINDIAQKASSCFGKKMVPIESDDFLPQRGASDDYGHVIEKYKSKIKDGNVILIANLNKIAASAARALHFICDTYSPIEKKAVILLELRVEESEEGSADAIAEKTLIELWGSDLAGNELDPLITRVTDQVIFLNSAGD